MSEVTRPPTPGAAGRVLSLMATPEPAHAELGSAPTVTRILRDAANRAVLSALDEARDEPLDIATLQSRALPEAPGRFVRDRLRMLADYDIVERAAEGDHRTVGATSAWTLTSAGRDLHRIHALIARIVTRAGAPKVVASGHRRDRAVETALDALADPAMLRILSRLAAAPEPLDPDALEVECRPVTRRTLYRRLRVLQDEGIVVRLVTHEVPRRTHYALHDRWRPVAGVLLLAAWWELRHGPARDTSLDLATLLHLVAPIARVPRGLAGSGAWVVAADGREITRVAVRLRDGHIQIDESARPEGDSVTVTGQPLAWAAALVTDDRSGLEIVGEQPIADGALAGVRAALLAYVR